MSKTTSETFNSAQSVLSEIANSAAETINQGKESAYQVIGNTLPTIEPAIKRGAYLGCYYLAFGVVYSAKVIEGLLPKDSVIRYGLKDGVGAAKETYERRNSNFDATSDKKVKNVKRLLP